MDKNENEKENEIESHKHCDRCLSVLRERGYVSPSVVAEELGENRWNYFRYYQCDCGLWVEDRFIIKQIFNWVEENKNGRN